MISPGMKKFYVYLAIASIIVLFLFMPLVVPYLSRSTDYSVFNDDWNGTSKFYVEYLKSSEINNMMIGEDQFLNTILGDISELVPISDEAAILLMIGPKTAYSQGELEFLVEFLSRGGTLLLADDFGSGNTILEFLSVEERFSNHPMMDLVYEKSGAFPIVFKGDGLSEYDLLMNRPSTIMNASEPLSFSTDMSFLDVNDNGSYDEDEPMGPFATSAKVEIERGEIYLISDPGIFINNMFERLDNKAFISSVLEDLSENYQRALYIDEAHLGPMDDIKALELVIKAPNNGIFKVLMATFLVLVLILECQLMGHLNRMLGGVMKKFKFGKITTIRGTDRKELIIALKELHPEWQLSGLNSFFSKFK